MESCCVQARKPCRRRGLWWSSPWLRCYGGAGSSWCASRPWKLRRLQHKLLTTKVHVCNSLSILLHLLSLYAHHERKPWNCAFLFWKAYFCVHFTRFDFEELGTRLGRNKLADGVGADWSFGSLSWRMVWRYVRQCNQHECAHLVSHALLGKQESRIKLSFTFACYNLIFSSGFD